MLVVLEVFSMYLMNLKNFNAKGVCIEPLKEAIRDFKEILVLNKKKGIKIINGVVSDQSRNKIPFYRVNDDHGYYSLFRDVRFADNKIHKKFFVKSFTIDQLIFKEKKLKSVEMIKIDSEGAEFEILSKSKKTIAKFRPIIYCEVTRKKDEIIKFFKKRKYKLFTLTYDRIFPYSQKNFNIDILAISMKSDLINSLKRY